MLGSTYDVNPANVFNRACYQTEQRNAPTFIILVRPNGALLKFIPYKFGQFYFAFQLILFDFELLLCVTHNLMILSGLVRLVIVNVTLLISHGTETRLFYFIFLS